MIYVCLRWLRYQYKNLYYPSYGKLKNYVYLEQLDTTKKGSTTSQPKSATCTTVGLKCKDLGNGERVLKDQTAVGNNDVYQHVDIQNRSV